MTAAHQEYNVCGIIYNDTPYYFLKNLQGDIIEITDKNGITKARYSYDAWGVCTITSDTSGANIATINPFRYRGYYFDTESNFYYLQSRYYDPVVGRFINADDAMMATVLWFCSKSTNLYGYCSNDPISYYDLFGYLKLGKHWWNSVWFISTTIDVVIIAIPTLMAIKNILKAGKIAAALTKTAANMSRKALRDAFVEMGLKLAAVTGWAAIREIGGYIYDIITTVTGWSLGTLIAKSIDKLDGNFDGYIFA